MPQDLIQRKEITGASRKCARPCSDPDQLQDRAVIINGFQISDRTVQ